MVSMLSMGVFVSGLLLSANTTADMSPEVKAKVEQYKKHITEWAANPVVVNAVKEANAKGPIAGMANSKWDELGDKDEIVTSMQNSPAG